MSANHEQDRAAVLVRHIVKPCFHDGGSRITAGHVTASIIEGHSGKPRF